MALPQLFGAFLVLIAATPCIASNCDTSPNSVFPNACYSATGDFFACCPGGCSSSPQANVACPGIGGSNQLQSTPSLQFIEYASNTTQTFIGDPKAVGSGLKFRNEVRSLDGTTIGYTLGTCSISVGLQADMTVEGLCGYIIQLGADQITALGKFTAANVADLVVTGGIGIFSGARGRIVLTTIATGSDGPGFGQFLYQLYTTYPSPFPQPQTAQYSRAQLLATEGIAPVLPSSIRAPTFVLKEYQTSATTEALSLPQALGPRVFRNELFDSNDTPDADVLGFDTGTCAYLVGPLADGTNELVCLYTVHLGADYFVVRGLFTSRPTAVASIIGGAGKYATAKGQVEISKTATDAAGGTTFDYKVFLV